MDQKRFLLFIVLSMGILIGWNAFVMPRFLPPQKKPNAAPVKELVGKELDKKVEKDKGAAEKAVAVVRDKDDNEADEKPHAGADGEKTPAVAEKTDSDKPNADGENEPEEPVVAAKVPQFPERTVELGAP